MLRPNRWTGNYSQYDPITLIDRYFEGGVFLAVAFAAFYLIARMVTFKMPEERRKKVARKVAKMKLMPGPPQDLWDGYGQEWEESDDTDDEDIVQLESRDFYSSQNANFVKARAGKVHNLQTGVAWFVAHLLVIVLVAVLLHYRTYASKSTMFVLSLIGVSLSMFMLALATQQLLPRIVGVIYYSVVIVFVFATVLLVMIGKNSEIPNERLVRVIFEPPPANTIYRWLPMNGYPVCQMRWGAPDVSEEHRLTALDLVVFASAVYDNEGADMMQVVNNATVGTVLEGVELEELEDPHTVGRWAVFKLPKSRLRVLAVRGTRTTDDILSDIDFYSVVQVLQLFHSVLPILSVATLETVQDVVRGFGISWREKFDVDRVWEPVTEQAQRLKEKSSNESMQLVITGHSLGGMLAAVAGAKIKVPALAISPPGQLYTLRRFRTSLTSLEEHVTVIQPHQDLVPKTDVQPGFVQHVRCKAGFVNCHSETRTACEIFQKCGDPRGRTMQENCRANDML